MYYPCILYSFSCLSTETELDCGGGLGTEAHTTTKRRPRVGCATRRTPTEEVVNTFSFTTLLRFQLLNDNSLFNSIIRM